MYLIEMHSYGVHDYAVFVGSDFAMRQFLWSQMMDGWESVTASERLTVNV